MNIKTKIPPPIVALAFGFLIYYTKNINDFDIKVSSNYSLMSEISDYGANIEVSSTF